MSYLVLARKWRPRSFDTLIGQDHVVRALTHALSSGRLHHAWLFTGTRGVGKTTLSRILAKSLNCAQGVTATPCGHCQACTEIDAGRFVDYIELDAASNRGVDEMTQLLEQAVYAPSAGRYKVYMIDEVHMLTGHAFNAMLKTLEEPPEHVKFILATTDPQKIPVTVLSRCLQFNLKQMTVPAIVAHLQDVLAHEAIPAETRGLRLIAQAAAGSMRDALSLTDQAISFSGGNLTAGTVAEMLGTLDQHHLVALLQALAGGDARGILSVADDLAARGLSFQAALGDLAVLLSRVAIAQRLGHAQADDPMAEDVQRLAGALAPDDLQLFYAVAVHSRQELALAPDEYAGFVMACLRMLALLPADRVVPAAAPPPVAAAPAPIATSDTAAPQGVAALEPAASEPAASEPVVPEPVVSESEQPAAAAPGMIGEKTDAPEPAAPKTKAFGTVGPEVTTAGTVSAEAIPKAAAEPAAAEPVVPGPAASKPAVSEPVVSEPVVPEPAFSEPNVSELNVSEAAAPEAASLEAAAPDVATAESAGPGATGQRSGVPGSPLPELPDHADAPAGDWTADVPDVPDLPDDFDLEAPDDDTALQAGEEMGPGGLPSALSGLAPAPNATETPDPARMTARDWPAVAASLPVSGAARALALNSEWLAGDAHQVRLRVAIRTLVGGGAGNRLRTVLSEHFGRVLRLHIEHGATGADTAHAVDQAERGRRQQAAEQAAAGDELVGQLVRRFGARIVPGSVQPPAV